MRSCRVGLIVMFMALLAGCSGTADRAEGAARDRIVVATTAGAVFTVDPAGGDRIDFAAGGNDEQGLQPVWSPDGTRLAWSERSGFDFSIVTANADASERVRTSTLFSGYFGYWDPTSTQLAFLGNAAPGTGVVLDDGSGTELNSVVDSDTFYYLSWSPDGTRWFVHSGSGLRIVDLDGTRTEIDLDDGFFRAPVWAPDGTVLLGLRLDGENVIARYDPRSGGVESLLDVGSIANFVLDPTGRYLAVESVDVVTGDVDSGDAVQVSFAQGAELAQVLVYDLQDGTTRQIFDERTGGLWWSPDGSKLAMLVGEDGDSARAAQWLVWADDQSFRTEPFQPSRLFVSTYVPFYDQFAQSVTPWSPDSSRFVYTGVAVDGTTGVFVQVAQPDTQAALILGDDGVAFWSPT